MRFKLNSHSMAVTHCDTITMGVGTDDNKTNQTRIFLKVPVKGQEEKERNWNKIPLKCREDESFYLINS